MRRELQEGVFSAIEEERSCRSIGGLNPAALMGEKLCKIRGSISFIDAKAFLRDRVRSIHSVSGRRSMGLVATCCFSSPLQQLLVASCCLCLLFFAPAAACGLGSLSVSDGPAECGITECSIQCGRSSNDSVIQVAANETSSLGLSGGKDLFGGIRHGTLSWDAKDSWMQNMTDSNASSQIVVGDRGCGLWSRSGLEGAIDEVALGWKGDEASSLAPSAARLTEPPSTRKIQHTISKWLLALMVVLVGGLISWWSSNGGAAALPSSKQNPRTPSSPQQNCNTPAVSGATPTESLHENGQEISSRIQNTEQASRTPVPAATRTEFLHENGQEISSRILDTEQTVPAERNLTDVHIESWDLTYGTLEYVLSTPTPAQCSSSEQTVPADQTSRTTVPAEQNLSSPALDQDLGTTVLSWLPDLGSEEAQLSWLPHLGSEESPPSLTHLHNQDWEGTYVLSTAAPERNLPEPGTWNQIPNQNQNQNQNQDRTDEAGQSWGESIFIALPEPDSEPEPESGQN